jgi:hypothetical protein
LTIRKNIIVHHKAYSLEGGIIGIEPYGANSTYNTVVNGGLLTINQNCYFNNEGVLFNLFAVNETPDRNLGGQYTFSAWKNRGYDGNSFSGDPELSPSYYPAQAACQSFGHYAQ